MATKYLASMEDWDMFMLHKGYADAPDICSMTRSEHARAVRSWLLEHEFHERTCKMTRTSCGAWKCSCCGTVEAHNIEPLDVYPYPHCPHCTAKVVE